MDEIEPFAFFSEKFCYPGFELGFDHWGGQFVPLPKILGNIFIFRGTEICTPFC